MVVVRWWCGGGGVRGWWWCGAGGGSVSGVIVSWSMLRAAPSCSDGRQSML